MDKDIRYKEMIGYLKESKEFIFINIVTMVFISAFLVSEDLPIIDIFLITREEKNPDHLLRSRNDS